MLKIKNKIKYFIAGKLLRLAFYYKDKYCKDVPPMSDKEAYKGFKISIYYKMYEIACRMYS